ncbi:unnamed protein product [Rotaria sordida]|uniref:Uncharacterized protein n=1 Tax=Rotaria sordida TaxID=392033 RepID=A0A813Z6J4_9BILA|nr:unnamed protein product [Rotaria sordida]
MFESFRSSNLDESSQTINHNSMDIDDNSTQMYRFNRPVDNTKNEADNEIKQIPISTIIHYCGLCPLTFDGAFGLTKTKLLTRLCSNQIVRQRILYPHFIHVHSMGANYAKRLVKAILQGQDPKTTKLFSDDEDIFNKK